MAWTSVTMSRMTGPSGCVCWAMARTPIEHGADREAHVLQREHDGDQVEGQGGDDQATPTSVHDGFQYPSFPPLSVVCSLEGPVKDAAEGGAVAAGHLWRADAVSSWVRTSLGTESSVPGEPTPCSRMSSAYA